MNEESSSSGRVKGSIKDRLKSFLYRKRYRIKLDKNSPVKKEIKVKFNGYRKFKVANIRDLNALGDKVIKVDLSTEQFDFEKYDYYIIEPVKKKGLDIKTKEEAERKKKTIDKVKDKTKNIKAALNDAKIDIKNKKETEKKLIKQKEEIQKKRIELENEIERLKSLKVEPTYIAEIKMNSLKDIERATSVLAHYEEEYRKYNSVLESKRKEIYNKISNLKDEIYSLNIVGIDIEKLDNIKIEDEQDIEIANKKIEFYEQEIEKYKKNLDIVNSINTAEFVNPIGVEVEKEEIKIEKVEKRETLEDNKSLEETKENINKESKLTLYQASKKEIEKKKLEVINKYDGKIIKSLQIKDDKLKQELNNINSVVNSMNEEVNKVTKNIVEITRTEGYGKIITSALKVAAGILTLPFSKANIFNITLGSALINRGVNGIRQGLETKKEIKVNYDYKDLTEKIRNTKNKLELTETMIKDSLTQINILKSYDDLGAENLAMLKKLEESLNRKLKSIDTINTKLQKQDEQNKIKIKKVERNEY